LKERLRYFLANPETRGLDLDDPVMTETRRAILSRHRFLRSIYLEWYQLMLAAIPRGQGGVVELGSGAGFLSDISPEVIASEVCWYPHIKLVLDGCALPFPDRSLKALVMTDVLHHIPRVRKFFSEAARCLRPGGVIAMIEPWNTAWSSWVYRNLHHEPFFPDSVQWEFETAGPLSGANGALPWIIFSRDRKVFESEFPQFDVETLRPMMPFCYLLSGGLSMRCLAPVWAYSGIRAIERLFDLGASSWGMFAYIVLRRCG
jgi:SAM-dependent methyltransferase